MPITDDVWGAVMSVCMRAIPKSMTFTKPSRVTITFPGLMSRWTMPCACAEASAAAIFCVRSTDCIGVSRRPPARNSASVRPSTNSITMY